MTTLTERRAASQQPPNTTIGDHDLCAWQPVRGVTWVQTRNPKHANRLARRSDSRQVMVGVAGGYLRTFEFRHSLGWAVRLMNRYTANVTRTGAASNLAICPERSRKSNRVGGPPIGHRRLVEAISFANPALGTSAVSTVGDPDQASAASAGARRVGRPGRTFPLGWMRKRARPGLERMRQA
jgi:hypothetical protein